MAAALSASDVCRYGRGVRSAGAPPRMWRTLVRHASDSPASVLGPTAIAHWLGRVRRRWRGKVGREEGEAGPVERCCARGGGALSTGRGREQEGSGSALTY
eukprot:3684124-Rhodomonas_salina.4